MMLRAQEEFILRCYASAGGVQRLVDMHELASAVRKLGQGEGIALDDLPLGDRAENSTKILLEKGFLRQEEDGIMLTSKGEEEIHLMTDEHTSDIDDLEAFLWGDH